MTGSDLRTELTVLLSIMQELLYRLQRTLDAIPPQEQERSPGTREHPQDVPF